MTKGVNLFCPICGQVFVYAFNEPAKAWHHKEFGWVHNDVCFREAEMKFARLVLRKSEV